MSTGAARTKPARRPRSAAHQQGGGPDDLDANLRRRDLGVGGREVTGAIHSVKNLGGNGAELATYVVEKGKPLVVVVKRSP